MADKGPKDTSLQSTKQMLDELDALMERMLSLPANEADTAPPPAKETTKSPGLAASLTMLDEPAKAPAAKSSPTVATIAAPAKKPVERRPRTKLPHPPIKPPHLSMPAVKIPMVPPVTEDEPAPRETTVPEPVTNEVVPPSSDPAPLAEDASGVSTSSGRRGGPLLWINRRFDRATMVLGGVGKIMRGPFGRTLLGLMGIALIAVATAWVLKDYLGWNWQ